MLSSHDIVKCYSLGVNADSSCRTEYCVVSLSSVTPHLGSAASPQNFQLSLFLLHLRIVLAAFIHVSFQPCVLLFGEHLQIMNRDVGQTDLVHTTQYFVNVDLKYLYKW
uniref:Uncharacterized protein n=1 Tax=Pyxicephalus adspersus TaxID=30357 RepID=A0AAV3B6I4_PYXAD|nr:TPA: hypothetical protein GDO54_001086 [Pyxicephalus adspersus]